MNLKPLEQYDPNSACLVIVHIMSLLPCLSHATNDKLTSILSTTHIQLRSKLNI